MKNTNSALAMMSYSVGDDMKLYDKQNTNYEYNKNNLSAWGYWRDHYYPEVIRESYPIYIRERAEDKGKQAFAIIKQLQDKKFIKLNKVSDFIDAMDTLIKIL